MSQTMLYKCPGPHDIHGGKFDFVVVNDDDIEATLAAGWHLTTPEAKAAHEGKSAKSEASDNAAPTRAELEQKAAELGIKFHPQTGDKKLAEKIEDALKGQ